MPAPGMPMGTMHRNNTCWDREQGHTWTQRNSSVPWPAGLGHFPATNTQAGPLCPSPSAHVARPRLRRRRCCYNISPNISTAPAPCDLPRSNPSSCPASSTAFLQMLSHFSSEQSPERSTARELLCFAPPARPFPIPCRPLRAVRSWQAVPAYSHYTELPRRQPHIIVSTLAQSSSRGNN